MNRRGFFGICRISFASEADGTEIISAVHGKVYSYKNNAGYKFQNNTLLIAEIMMDF